MELTRNEEKGSRDREGLVRESNSVQILSRGSVVHGEYERKDPTTVLLEAYNAMADAVSKDESTALVVYSLSEVQTQIGSVFIYEPFSLNPLYLFAYVHLGHISCRRRKGL